MAAISHGLLPSRRANHYSRCFTFLERMASKANRRILFINQWHPSFAGQTLCCIRRFGMWWIKSEWSGKLGHRCHGSLDTLELATPRIGLSKSNLSTATATPWDSKMMHQLLSFFGCMIHKSVCLAFIIVNPTCRKKWPSSWKWRNVSRDWTWMPILFVFTTGTNVITPK